MQGWVRAAMRSLAGVLCSEEELRRLALAAADYAFLDPGAALLPPPIDLCLSQTPPACPGIQCCRVLACVQRNGRR
jgi:hypothetical protein